MNLQRNKIIAIACLAFSIFIIYLAFQIEVPPSATSDFLGPKGFPLIISTLLILCSIGIFFMRENPQKENEEQAGVKEIVNLLPFLGVLFLFLLILPYIGMVIGIFLLMMVLINLIEKGNWLNNTIISSSVAIGIWLIFAQLLNIAIPAWPSI